MLNKIKKHVLPMLDTLNEVIEYLCTAGGEGQILAEAAEFIASINDVLADENACACGRELLSLLPSCSNPLCRGQLSKVYMQYCKAIYDIPTQYKAVFLPYYDNTWDSLKSVYEAFSRDPQFVTEIVIIPIKRNIPAGYTNVYNDYLTPAGIPNTHYDLYDFEADQPDIVFYNNPYDGVNYPKFQSHNIKPYASLMVYIPYFVTGDFYSPKEIMKKRIIEFAGLPGHDNADIFVVYGDWYIRKYGMISKNGGKMVALGSPKLDNIYLNKGADKWQRHEDWEQKLKSGRVFLLNTHYTLATVNADGDNIKLVNYLFNFIRDNEETALIWRPHPQTFLMLENRSDENALQFQAWFDDAEKSERIVVDRTANVMSAFMYCEAVISSYLSSINYEAVFMDKPTFIFECDPLIAAEQNVYFKREFMSIMNRANAANERHKYLHNAISAFGVNETIKETGNFYQAFKQNPLTEFLNDILAGIDKKKELREEYIKYSFNNTNGTCGKSILEYIKGKLAEQELIK